MLPGRKYTPFDFLEMAWRRRWIIVVPMILGAYAALIVSSRLKDQFQSEMLIQVVPQRVPDSFVKSTVTMRTEDRLNALSQQVQSRTELERIILQMNLYPEERQKKPMQDVIERMRTVIKVDPVKSQRESRETDAFFVRFTYPDKEIATRVTERLGALFINENSRDRGSLAEATNSFLENQLADAKQRLETTEKSLEQFRERNAGRLPSQIEFNMQAIQNAQLQVQAQVESLARDKDRKLLLERLYNDALAEPAPAPPTPPVAAGADPAAQRGSPQQQLVTAREALAQMELRLKPEHPDVVRTKRLIADLEKRVAADNEGRPASDTPAVAMSTAEGDRRTRLQQMRAEIESLDRQIQFKEAEEQRLRRTVADYQSRLEQTPGVESESVALTRDYQTLQETYTDLLTKSEQSKVAVELEKRQIGEQFRVLDAARVPIRPTGLPRVQVNAAGAAVGLALGLALAVLLELRDSTLRTGRDVVDVFQLPVMALVPYLVSDADRRRERRRRMLVSVTAAVAAVAGGYGVWALQLWKHLK